MVDRELVCERSLETSERVMSDDLDGVRVYERLLDLLKWLLDLLERLLDLLERLLDLLEWLLDLLDLLAEYNFSNLESLFACRSAMISNLDDNLDEKVPIDACKLDDSTCDNWSKKVFPDVWSIVSDGATY